MKRVGILAGTVLFVAGVLLSGCGKKMTEQQYYNLATEYEQNEDFNKAAETFMTLYKRFPTGKHGAEALFKAALIYGNQLKNFQQAIAIHEQLIRTFPESKYAQQALFMIGFIYANDIKDFQKAKEYYNKFLERYPDNELVSSVKWELENLGKDINEINFLSDQKADSTVSK